MAIWDSTISSLNPYLWLKMNSGLTNYGSLASYYYDPVEAGPGNAITYNSSGGKTGAYITYPTNDSRYIFFRPTSTYASGMSGKTFTVGLWFKKYGIGSDASELLNLYNLSDSQAIRFILPGTGDQYNAGKLVFNANSSTGGAGGGIPGNLYTSVDNNWHFAALSVNGSTIKYYYDGQNVGQSTLDGNIRPQRWRLGEYSYGVNLDDLVYFNYVLSDSQISQMYQAAQDVAPIRYWDNNNWVSPQQLLLWNNQTYVSPFGHKFWDGTTWLDIVP